jgi:hypothetical protein
VYHTLTPSVFPSTARSTFFVLHILNFDDWTYPSIPHRRLV